MNISSESNITTGFILALLIMLAIGAVAYRSTLEAHDDSVWVEHTQTVLTSLETLVSSITDVETGVRGYVITGNPTYLDLRQAALDRVTAKYAELRELTADNTEQQHRLDTLKPVLDARLALFTKVIETVQSHDPAAAAAIVASGEGKQLHDHIRRIVDAMSQVENDLLRQRAHRAAQSNRYTRQVIVLGNLFGLILIALSLWQLQREMSQRRMAEQVLRDTNAKLAEATARAQHADHIKSAFLATMSHELRTPLNSIIGFGGILRQEMAGAINPEQAKQLDMMLNSARHLLSLINDVLDISKIEAGQMTVRRAPFDLHDTLDEVIAGLTPLAEKKGLLLSTRLAPELGSVPYKLLSDRRRVQQILINLLSNAIKFTERGAVILEAETSPDASTLCFRVRDSGIGIKPEEIAILFQPFRQLDNGLARKHEGTGLGLAICQRLAEMLGGRIEVESLWGKGSTFSFFLPLGTAEQS
ncbi:MAG: hypothetical protein GJU76_10805 [Gallionella sp.]|nr:hypothetical protein [Gallionella sp.]